MAITSYEKDGKTFYKVYIQIRSKTMSSIRVQKTKYGIKSETAARREEKKLTRLVFERIARIEAKGITWKELILRWDAHARNGLVGRPYTREARIDLLNMLYNHTDTWFEKRIRELSRADGRYVINTLERNSYSASRIKAIKGCINKLWNWGLEEGLVLGGLKSPVHGLFVESLKDKFRPILTLEEVRRLLYEAEIRKHPWRHIWAVAILSGMRSGELFALTWDDVDFDNNIIRITKSYSQRLQRIKSTKNSEWRNAHISEDLKNVLLEVKKIFPNSENVLPRKAGWNNGNGGYILRVFLTRIGIDKYITFHTLRACFATHTLASGAEPTQVMKMGGWADFKTFQIYVRMAGVDVKGVTDRLRIMPRLGSLDNVVKFSR